MSDNGRWLKLYPKILDSRVFSDEKCLKLWIWCLCKANYKVGYFNGQEIGPGSFVTGKFTGSEECEISTSAWYRGIEKLVEGGMITKTSNHHWTTISLCNWQTYQQFEIPKTDFSEPPLNHQRTTTEPPLNPIVEGIERKERKKHTGAGKPPGELTFPEVLQTEEFQAAWAEWQAHRLEKKKPLTPTSTKKQLTALANMGVVRAIVAIDHSIANGWQGIFEPDARNVKDELLPTPRIRYLDATPEELTAWAEEDRLAAR